MKNILRKTQQKIYAIFQTLKAHASKLRISSFVGGQFKKRQYNDHRDIDWYYQESWFDRKWFKHKLKRFIMNFVYKIYTKISESLLSTYLFEIEFYTQKSNKLDEYNKKHNTNHKGDFICYLPIIIKAKEQSEADAISIAIRRELETEYGITARQFSISDKILTEDYYRLTIEKLENKFKGYEENLGFIDIITLTPKQKNSFDESYNVNKDRKYIRVIKSGPLPFKSQNFEYVVKYYKVNDEE